MSYILFGILIVVDVIIIALMFVTYNHLEARIARNEEFLKTYSEDIKQMKLLLRKEVAMAMSDTYPVANAHVDYVAYDDTPKQGQ